MAMREAPGARAGLRGATPAYGVCRPKAAAAPRATRYIQIQARYPRVLAVNEKEVIIAAGRMHRANHPDAPPDSDMVRARPMGERCPITPRPLLSLAWPRIARHRQALQAMRSNHPNIHQLHSMATPTIQYNRCMRLLSYDAKRIAERRPIGLIEPSWGCIVKQL